jgi:hypothetical protein
VNSFRRSLTFVPWEAIAWMLGIIALAVFEPGRDQHIVVCPFALAGIDFCPGCGLGRSISLLLHGEWRESFSAHVMGLPALIILSYRIVQLTLTKPYLWRRLST